MANMDAEFQSDELVRVWLAAGGNDTLGILRATALNVIRWVRMEIAADEVADLRSGGDHTSL